MTLSRFLAAAIMISLFSLCMSLGFWQLERAEEKQALVDAGQQQIAADELGEKSIWSATTLDGHYIPELPALLDSQTYQGQPGYQVFSRFELSDGRQLLVNRGWIAKGVELTKAGDAFTRVAGIVAPYKKAGMRLGPPVLSPPAVRPVVVNYPTQQEWEALYQQPLLPITLWLDADQEQGFVRDWQIQSIAPEKHLGYAFQWFAMATAVAVIALILLIRIRRSHD